MRDFFRSPAHLDKAADWLTEHRLNQREPVTRPSAGSHPSDRFDLP